MSDAEYELWVDPVSTEQRKLKKLFRQLYPDGRIVQDLALPFPRLLLGADTEHPTVIFGTVPVGRFLRGLRLLQKRQDAKIA